MILKTSAILICVACCFNASAQQISGQLIDADSRAPIIYATVSSSIEKTRTDIAGHFTVKIARNDTIKIDAAGYNQYMVPVKDLQSTRSMTIVMQKTLQMLKEVMVYSNRNRVRDSINNRQQYAGIFNYKPDKIKDAFTTPPANVPFAFVTIDLGKLIDALNKKNDPAYKRQQLLIRDEQNDYIRSRYSKQLITRVTGLKGDSLQLFTDRYYPVFTLLKKMSDYDLVIYLKQKLKAFRLQYLKQE